MAGLFDGICFRRKIYHGIGLYSTILDSTRGMKCTINFDTNELARKPPRKMRA